jgi:16S rRNA (cytosine967-C5)-methyltransferase
MAPTDPTRTVALQLLRCVFDRHRPLESGLDEVPAAPRDRAAGHRLAAAVLRRTASLDAALEPWLRRAPPSDVRHILRLGAAGLLLLDTPAHAAVGTSVALARAQGLAPFAGLVNAVLRRVAEAGPAVLATLDGPRHDTPAWLWARWGEDARAIATAHQHEATLDLTVKRDVPPLPGERLLPTGSRRLPPGTPVADLPGYEEGDFWVQDAAAALPARLLAPQPGETIADLCAAPGGKTAQLAAAGARVFALDRDASRLARLTSNMARLHLDCVTVQADATAWTSPNPLDAVLLDAPCSATGTIRRHPDVPHLKREAEIAGLTEQQDRLLAHAATLLAPGGRLVYAVCSLQQAEGADRIAAALASGLWQEDPFTAGELAMLPEARNAEGHLRTHPGLWPDLGGMDGFFAARLRRR